MKLTFYPIGGGAAPLPTIHADLACATSPTATLIVSGPFGSAISIDGGFGDPVVVLGLGDDGCVTVKSIERSDGTSLTCKRER